MQRKDSGLRGSDTKQLLTLCSWLSLPLQDYGLHLPRASSCTAAPHSSICFAKKCLN